MAIYFLRHGESESNIRGLFAGQREDSVLTEKGIEQARMAAGELRQVGLARIFSSRLKRAFETASIVAEILEFDRAKIEIDERILEYDMGALTGTPIRKVTSEELTAAAGAEDPSKFRGRVLSFLRQYKNNSENILIVSHAGVGRTIESARLGLSPNEFYNLDPYPNAQAVRLDLSWL